MLGKITFKTTDPSDIGINHFTIRNCDVKDNLNEIHFYVHVQNNAPYVFEQPLQTVFSVKFNDTLTYFIPAISSTSSQSKPVIVITPFEDYEDFFPKFMVTFDKMDRIQFVPKDPTMQNKTYYFKIIVKGEGNQDSEGYPYYCSVKVVSIGAKIDSGNQTMPEVDPKLPVFQFFTLQPVDKTIERSLQLNDKQTGAD